jgi:hypothetical protein
VLSGGLGLISASSSKASDWVGGVHTTQVFYRWQGAWDYYAAGVPNPEQYNQLMADCTKKHGSYITKAGTGTISGNGGGATTVTLDYSCWN